MISDEAYQAREKEWHQAIWKLVDQICNLEDEIKNLKGGETKDEKKNIIYFDPFWNGTAVGLHHADGQK
jgi:hypothetical protein